MSQPPYPPQPVGTPPIKPAGGWYALGGALIVLGLIGAVTLGVLGFVRTSERVDDFQRVAVPGTGTVNLTESGDYTLYLEYPGASSDDMPSSGGRGRVEVRITDPSGAEVHLERYGSNVVYSFGGHEGEAGFSFQVARPGAYEVTTTGDSHVTVAIGEGLGSFVGSLVGAIVLGVAGFVLGSVAIIVVAVKRSGGKRRAAGGWYPPQGGPREY